MESDHSHERFEDRVGRCPSDDGAVCGVALRDEGRDDRPDTREHEKPGGQCCRTEERGDSPEGPVDHFTSPRAFALTESTTQPVPDFTSVYVESYEAV